MILVTGATGTVGRELLPQLLEAGEKVRASGIGIGIDMDKVPKAGRPNRRLLRPQLRSPMSPQTAYENEDEPRPNTPGQQSIQSHQVKDSWLGHQCDKNN